MGTNVFWIDGPWKGRVAVAARPRGGDWLLDDLAAWRRAGIASVLSLLTAPEEHELCLEGESSSAKAQGMKFVSFPIPDRQTPNSETELAALLDTLEMDLSAGRNVLIHCRQGIGRSGLVAACLLVTRGISPEEAVGRVSSARGALIPDTEQQRAWISHYAAVLPGTK